MRITYVARSFLDYRVPVLVELDRLSGGELHFISSNKWTPERPLRRLRALLEDKALFLTGERSLGVDVPIESNTSVCIPWQPGLLKAISATQPQVIIGDGFFQWTYAALLHRILYRTPLVICYERWFHTEKAAQWYRKLYRRLCLKLSSAVCCNGRLSADYTTSLGFPRHHITTGHMAADTENLLAQAKAVPPEDLTRLRESWNVRGMLVLYVGQLIKRKGLAVLLQEWQLFEAQYPAQSTLLVVGAGPEEPSLKALAHSLNLAYVRFVGPVDYSQLAPYYAAADVFIIPTLEDNWSLVVPEAMACGLPVACSKYNGCWPELVQEGRNGWVFDPLSRGDTLRVLETSIRNQDHLGAMGQASLEILKDHTPRKAAEAILSACRLALTPRTVKASQPQFSRA